MMENIWVEMKKLIAMLVMLIFISSLVSAVSLRPGSKSIYAEDFEAKHMKKFESKAKYPKQFMEQSNIKATGIAKKSGNRAYFEELSKETPPKQAVKSFR